MTFIEIVLFIFVIYLLVGYCLLWWLLKGITSDASYKEWLIITLFWPLFLRAFFYLKIMSNQLKHIKRHFENENNNC